MLGELLMSGEDKRRSERVIPVVTDEEVVVIQAAGRQTLAKMLDFSEVGTLVYLLVDSAVPVDVAATCTLTLCHHGSVFDVLSRVARKSGRLIGFEFINPDAEALHHIQEKLIRLEVEWMRLSRSF